MSNLQEHLKSHNQCTYNMIWELTAAHNHLDPSNHSSETRKKTIKPEPSIINSGEIFYFMLREKFTKRRETWNMIWYNFQR